MKEALADRIVIAVRTEVARNRCGNKFICTGIVVTVTLVCMLSYNHVCCCWLSDFWFGWLAKKPTFPRHIWQDIGKVKDTVALILVLRSSIYTWWILAKSENSNSLQNSTALCFHSFKSFSLSLLCFCFICLNLVTKT